MHHLQPKVRATEPAFTPYEPTETPSQPHVLLLGWAQNSPLLPGENSAMHDSWNEGERFSQTKVLPLTLEKFRPHFNSSV